MPRSLVSNVDEQAFPASDLEVPITRARVECFTMNRETRSLRRRGSGRVTRKRADVRCKGLA
jgi:hypothetical protein